MKEITRDEFYKKTDELISSSKDKFVNLATSLPENDFESVYQMESAMQNGAAYMSNLSLRKRSEFLDDDKVVFYLNKRGLPGVIDRVDFEEDMEEGMDIGPLSMEQPISHSDGKDGYA